ncbi:hypothetical protein NDU88_006618 [Pleurodeles waltl]|uniref:Uncharacterized protein n=1 Tax=Pleurodeles waltl TaxID=8319 RepID=A0AAV7TYB0_PLEWA|nr:hypothetical protein NDU88_006618 [Pleurodeles waltl]
MAISLYQDFTVQVQEVRRQFLQGKRWLHELQIDYNMLDPARLRVMVTLIFTDSKKFIEKCKVKGRRRFSPKSGGGESDTVMDNAE